MSENNKQDTDPWIVPTFRNIALGALALMMVLFVGTVLLTCCTHNECYPKRFNPPLITLCVDSTSAKVDSVALTALQDSVNILSRRQHDWYDNYLSDLRQESNNNINKYNGWLSLWIAFVTILLTLVPSMGNANFCRVL